MKLSRKATRMGPSAALEIHYRLKEMLRQGRDVVSLTVGEPGFKTPAHIKTAGIEAIEQDWTKYALTSGLPELKEAICFFLKENYGLEYASTQIVVTVGAKQALINAMIALLDPGDEVLIPIPSWFSYTEQVNLLDAVPVIVPTLQKNGFQLKAAALGERITPKTKLLIFNTPNNPTGAVVAASELEKIAALAVKHDFYILSDEIYSEILFDNAKHFSIANVSNAAKELTITINGVSKAYAMTGWRVGYAAGPQNVIDAMGTIQGHFTSGANTMAQRAAITALCGPQDCVQEMLQAYAHRRNYIVERLNAMQDVTCLMPQGTFYAFPDISRFLGRRFHGSTIDTSSDLGKYLLESQGVGVVPGRAFGGEGHIRLSFACDMDVIEKGCDRIERALKG